MNGLVKPSLGLRAAQKLTRLLDHHHLDPVMGLMFSFAGDVAGGLLGLYLLLLAWRNNKPRLVLARMALNTAIDTGVGAVPIVGDLFDYWFRANSRNLVLLERDEAAAGLGGWDGLWLALSLFALLVALCLPLVVLALLVRWLIA